MLGVNLMDIGRVLVKLLNQLGKFGM